MANSSAVVILDANQAPRTVSTIDAMLSAAGSPSAANVLTVQYSTNTVSGGGTTLSSGLVAIINGNNTVAVKAANTAASSADSAMVVGISPNGLNANGQNTAANSSPVVVASDNAAIPMALTSSGTNPVSATQASTFTVNLSPRTTGGLTLSSVIASSTTNSTLLSSAPCQLYSVEVFNNSSNIAYLKFYNFSSAPTAGSSQVVERYMVPGNPSGAGFIKMNEFGRPYATGLGYTFTGAIADSDTTVVAASAFIINIMYK